MLIGSLGPPNLDRNSPPMGQPMILVRAWILAEPPRTRLAAAVRTTWGDPGLAGTERAEPHPGNQQQGIGDGPGAGL